MTKLDELDTPTISIDLAAKLLGVSRSHAYEMANRGELPVLKLGRSRRVVTAGLRQMFELDRSPASAQQRSESREAS